MELSNRTLSYLLVVAIVASFTITLAGVNNVGILSFTGYSTTQPGDISMYVNSLVSITTVDNPTLSFGNCRLSHNNFIIINSENTLNTSSACPEYEPGVITVRNNGNVNVQVTVSPSEIGTADGGFFLENSTGSYIEYKIVNDGYPLPWQGGCVTGGFPNSYQRFNSLSDFNVCTDLRSSANGNNQNSVSMEIQIGLPSDVNPGNYSVNFLFTATSII